MKNSGEWWRKWRTGIQERQPKTILLTILCCFLILLPTLLAFANVFAVNHSVAVTETLTVTIYDSDRNQIATASATPDRISRTTLVRIFSRMLESPQALNSLPGDPEDEKVIYLRTEKNGVIAEYSCYFSFLSGASYFLDANGGAYRIPNQVTEDFLSTSYAESLYADATPPSLLTNANEVILPYGMTWFYKRYDGVFDSTTATDRNTATETREYEIAGAVEIHFARDPDVCSVRAYDEDNSEVFEGTCEELATLTVSSGNRLRLEIHAVWDQQSDSTGYGEVNYSFYVTLRNRSVFSTDQSELMSDGFVLLTCTNIGNPSQILFTSDVLPAPTFYACKDGAIALIPCPQDFSGDSVRFTVTYGATEQEFTLPVRVASAAPEFSIPSLPGSTAPLSVEAYDRLQLLLKNVPAPQYEHIYFPGNFLDPADMGFTAGYRFRSVVTVVDAAQGIVAFGNEYLSSALGDQVALVMSGEVVKTGSTPRLGNYVAVDHGAGLVTWYAHLSSIDVTTGDLLKAGESVGKCGNGGISTGNGFLLLCTISGQVVSPDYILGRRILGKNFSGEKFSPGPFQKT